MSVKALLRLSVSDYSSKWLNELIDITCALYLVRTKMLYYAFVLQSKGSWLRHLKPTISSHRLHSRRYSNNKHTEVSRYSDIR